MEAFKNEFCVNFFILFWRRRMATIQRMASAFPGLLILFLARVWSFRPVAAEPFATDGAVIELNDSNFESAISTFDYIFVDFYAPWCGHCKKLSPELDEAASILTRLNLPIIIAKLDSDKYRKLASKHEIESFPTLKLFVHGIPIDYKGPRKAELLVRYLIKYVAPDVSVLESASDVHSFVEEAGKHFPIFIGFGLDESLISNHGKRYKKKSWFAVAKSFSEETLVAYEFEKSPALVVIHPSYNEQNVFYGPFNGGFLDDFVRQNQLPLVVPINYETLTLLNNDERKVVLTIVDDEMSKNSQDLYKILRYVAIANRDLVFGYIGVKQWEDFVVSFDVDKNVKLPKILVWDGNVVYQLVEGLESLNSLEDTESQIIRFLEGYREGRTIEKEIIVPSLMRFISSHVSIKTAYLIIIAAAFMMLIQKLAKCGTNVRYSKRIQPEDEDPAGFYSENPGQQQDYQSGYKEE